MSSIIELSHLTKTYSAARAKALQDISLSFQANELIAIRGPSGSGKSTLLHLIGLLDRASSGHYQLNHHAIESLTADEVARVRNREIGFVFQSFYLLPHLSIERNIALPLLYRGLSAKESLQQAIMLLEKLQLTHLKSRRPYQLSGGEQQRIAIARAMVGKPNILLADEPTGALDTKTGQQIMDFFLELHQKQQKTIIIATHNAAIAGQCHRQILLQDGQLMDDYRSRIQ